MCDPVTKANTQDSDTIQGSFKLHIKQSTKLNQIVLFQTPAEKFTCEMKLNLLNTLVANI